jgi:antitoxin HicB
MLSETGMRTIDYAVLIEPLSDEDGGGFLATAPDLPGCMSDGDTREAAARNIEDAIACWLEEARAIGRDIPEPKRAARIA